MSYLYNNYYNNYIIIILMKKLISFCLYGTTSMYLNGAIENIIYAKEVYPDWICRFYCHQSVPHSFIKQLIEHGGEVFVINDNKATININWVKLWRFYPCSEKNIEYIIFRDADSRLSYKEKNAVDEWIKSGKNTHILHDSEAHGAIIPAGMWGIKGGIIDDIYKLINNYLIDDLNNDCTKCLWNSDQIFLEKYIWSSDNICNSYLAHGTNKHMVNKFPQLITSPYPKHQGFRTFYESFIGQKIYKKTLNYNYINVYHIESCLDKKTWVAHRVLGHLNKLELDNGGIKLVDNIKQATIIIGSYEKSIKQFIDTNIKNYDLRGKKFLVWCLEPKWSITGANLIEYNNFKIHIMNCYTSDVYVSPYQFCQIFSYKHFNQQKINREKYDSTTTKIVVIATAKNNNTNATVVVPGKNLVMLRYKIVMDIYNVDNNSIHIYGKNWPNNITKVYAGKETQVYKEKLDILSNYYFNICFENTSHDNYITEKIWHSIIGGCLPIYYGNPSIYKVFPENSFIDTTKFKTSQQLLSFIKNMKFDEFNRRFQLCYNIVKNLTPEDINNCNTLIRTKLEEKIKYISTLDNIMY
jgi:hypothetical protein